jgi:16S rRNA (adenine1518-N6/adenine1519-N6)-dimethyltransferase
MNIAALLARYGIQPSKGLGQNFVADESILARIVAASQVSPDDLVLEIGPGLGNLTRLLAEAAGQVVAVELDRQMVAILGNTLADLHNVRVVQGDILQLAPADLLGTTADGIVPAYQVVANLPYYITSAVLKHLLDRQRPRRLTLMVQREVAQRLVAEPGQLSLLALSVQVYGDPRIVLEVPAAAFYPPPKIDSAVVRIDVLPEPKMPDALLDSFFRVAHAGFSQKRKQLHNSLSAGLGIEGSTIVAKLQESGIDPKRRAQTLSLDEWSQLTELLQPLLPGRQGSDQGAG